MSKSDLLFPLEEVIWDHDGKELCIEERALAQLLLDDQLLPFESTEDGRTTTALFLNCSDIFAWGCCDDEPLLNDDIPAVYKLHAADRMWGTTRWVLIKRNEQPQAPVKKNMITNGAWDDVLEALPENQYDKRRREQRLSTAAVDVVHSPDEEERLDNGIAATQGRALSDEG